MVSLARLLVREADRSLRPGQPGASVITNRMLRTEGLGSGNAASLNHCSGATAPRVVRARYGRSRYARASHA
jgi:hypothetical protein